MKNKVVFITGAASGIGLEMGKVFARAGAKVVLSDLDADRLNNEVSYLRDQQLEVTGLHCDVTREEEVINVLNKTNQMYDRIDVLINNAGMQYISLIDDFPKDKFELLIAVMLVAPFVSIKHVFPIMKKQRFGRIINMASINGLIGFAGKAAYNSAKHGVIGLTKVAALEGATYGITVNAICPGYVDTPLLQNQLADLARTRNIQPAQALEDVIYPMVPQRRLLTVEEIAHYALFLASEKASGVTGQAVVIDGGYTVQ
jgi:3-hydroxybutyrate dehydrogenase